MPKWIIISGPKDEPRCSDYYTAIDEALAAWDHLRLRRRLPHHVPLRDILAMVIDEKEYPV